MIEYLHCYSFFQPTSLESAYGPFNIELVGSKMLMTSNMITYSHFLLVYKFKPNFTDKYFINNIINQVIDKLCFKIKTEYYVKCSHKHFLIEFDENRIMMHIFFNLKGLISNKTILKRLTC